MSTPLDMLFRRVAVEHRILTPEQAEQARHAQNDQSGDPPLPVVMVELGLLDHGQVAQTLREHRETFGDVDPAIASRIYSWSLAAHVLEHQMVAPDQVNLALREIGRREASRTPTPFLGDLLLSRKLVARDRLVEAMQKVGVPTARTRTATAVRPATGKAPIPAPPVVPGRAVAPKRPTGAVPRPAPASVAGNAPASRPATRAAVVRRVAASSPAVEAPPRGFLARWFGWLFRTSRRN